MQTKMKKSDAEVKTDVLAELKYEPSVKATDIGVIVNDGVVTLTGFATSFAEKFHANKAARRVAGVVAIADDMLVKFAGSLPYTDADIAASVASHVTHCVMIPDETKADVTVRDGWVTLAGQVDWWYQKDAVESTVRYLAGVKGITNLMTIKPQPHSKDVDKDINAAFGRMALSDGKRIQVEVLGSKIVLRGTVRNSAERDQAERTAWSAPGVTVVENDLKTEWAWF